MSRAQEQRPVWSWIEDAQEKLSFADDQVGVLDDLTGTLVTASAAAGQRRAIKGSYLSWLVFVRQISASIDSAGKAARNTADFIEWWESLKNDPTHAYFWEQRNAGLKRGAEIVELQKIVDPRIATLGYWTFTSGPHLGDPLVGRCQLYCDWLYKVLCGAQELLAGDTIAERLAHPKPFSWTD